MRSITHVFYALKNTALALGVLATLGISAAFAANNPPGKDVSVPESAP
jgi:hypothetical protein